MYNDLGATAICLANENPILPTIATSSLTNWQIWYNNEVAVLFPLLPVIAAILLKPLYRYPNSISLITGIPFARICFTNALFSGIPGLFITSSASNILSTSCVPDSNGIASPKAEESEVKDDNSIVSLGDIAEAAGLDSSSFFESALEDQPEETEETEETQVETEETEEVAEDLSLRNWNSERGKYESQGFSFNKANLIIEHSGKVVEIPLNEKDLSSNGVKIIREKKQISDFVEDGSTDYFLLGELTETGEVHFELENENNFDIKKLEIKTCSLNNWEIITDVIYDNNMINSVSEENDPLGENFTLAKCAK